jgi:hypothetical protein
MKTVIPRGEDSVEGALFEKAQEEAKQLGTF